LFVGQSCGMAVAGTLAWLDEHAEEIEETDVAVVVLPDSGFRYLRKTYNDEWMRGHGFLDEPVDFTVERVLKGRAGGGTMFSVGPDSTLGDAISYMMQYGVSQLPVIDLGTVVGSINESAILNHLIEHPGARLEPVRSIMKEPFPVVSPRLELGELSEMLDQGEGAVLVPTGPDGHYEIITKSDLIRTLASAGRNGSQSNQKGRNE
ncbi:MAG: CBS domain-containing protein, partial [Rhodothermales bacterium]|nr:CBS domain-containing protein [Rhodothermales bacterium]